jgi:hypothetical protein
MAISTSTPTFVLPTNFVDQSGGSTTANIQAAYAAMEAQIAGWNPLGLSSSAADSMYAVPTGAPTEEIQSAMARQASLTAQANTGGVNTGLSLPAYAVGQTTASSIPTIALAVGVIVLLMLLAK